MKTLNKKDFLNILKNVSENLDKFEIQHEIPYCHSDKDSYNYINIIIPDTIDTNNLIYNLDISNHENYKNIFTGEIDNFRFNFIKSPMDYFYQTFYYYCWNFYPYLIKCLIKPLNLEYDSYGLHYFYNKKKITLTKNLQEIFDFLNIDFKEIYGINVPTKKLLYQTIIDSFYFDSDSFNKKIFKEIDPMFKYNEKYYKEFLSIIPLQENKIKENEIINILDDYFKDFYEKITKIKTKEIKFNKNEIMETKKSISKDDIKNFKDNVDKKQINIYKNKVKIKNYKNN